MKRKNIKKINEFIDEFDFEIDNTELTLEECEIRKEEHDRVVEEIYTSLSIYLTLKIKNYYIWKN
jgi:hypothetical protein